MFALEQAIAEWRQRMLASGITTPVPLEELESHLRDDIEAQMEAGTDAQRAFASAIARIGPAMELRGEFQKANPIETMKQTLRNILILIALLAIEVGLILPLVAQWRISGHTGTVWQLLTGHLQPVCLALGLPLSLVLPLIVGALVPRDAGNVLPILVGALPPQDPERAGRWMRTVWTGQILMAVGGLWIILLPQQAVAGLVFAMAVCAVCACRLWQQLRPGAGVAH